MTATTSAFLLDLSKQAPEQAVSQLIDHAVDMSASDLFLVSNEQHVAAQVRHLGTVRTIAILDSEQGKRCISHIKATAGIELNSRTPQDGRWIYTRHDEDESTVDLRINSMPTLHGEDLAMRLLHRASKLFSLEKLGMNAQQLQQYELMINNPGGLVLITGPTGSGKTATLYATLSQLNNGRRKINTIEDPIEYAIDGLRQSQVNPAINLGFSELLRGVLRQSPDVIMIGEIRDAETAQTAVRAANSGILVLATMHASGVAGAVQSLRALGAMNQFLAASLRGVISQRLVRTLDTNTRRAVAGLTDGFDPFEEIRPMLSVDEGKMLYVPVATDANHMTGYSGRTGVFEVMPVTRELSSLIADSRPAIDLRNLAIEQGMLTFRQAALIKVARGETTSEEIFRVVPNDQMVGEE